MIECKYVLLLTGLISACSIYPQDEKNEYILFDKHQCSDLNYQKIDSLNSSEYQSGINLLNDIFSIKKGNFAVYRFLNFDKGMLYDEAPIQEIINLVIIKVNTENIIEDGFYYSLTNPEMPRTCHLFRLVNKIKFKGKVDLKTMIFKRIDIINHDELLFLDCLNDMYLKLEGKLICK